jgi:hypothetical protein
MNYIFHWNRASASKGKERDSAKKRKKIRPFNAGRKEGIEEKKKQEKTVGRCMHCACVEGREIKSKKSRFWCE